MCNYFLSKYCNILPILTSSIININNIIKSMYVIYCYVANNITYNVIYRFLYCIEI